MIDTTQLEQVARSAGFNLAMSDLEKMSQEFLSTIDTTVNSVDTVVDGIQAISVFLDSDSQTNDLFSRIPIGQFTEGVTSIDGSLQNSSSFSSELSSLTGDNVVSDFLNNSIGSMTPRGINGLLTSSGSINTREIQSTLGKFSSFPLARDISTILSSVDIFTSRLSDLTNKITAILPNASDGILNTILLPSNVSILDQLNSILTSPLDSVTAARVIHLLMIGNIQEAVSLLEAKSNMTIAEIEGIIFSVNLSIDAISNIDSVDDILKLGSSTGLWNVVNGVLGTPIVSQSSEDNIFSYVNTSQEFEGDLRSAQRDISALVLDWTETFMDEDLSVQDLLTAGKYEFHYLILRNGTLQRMVPIDVTIDDSSLVIGFVGGFAAMLGAHSEDRTLSLSSLTPAQMNTYRTVSRSFFRVNPGLSVLGRNELNRNSTSPGFTPSSHRNSTLGQETASENSTLIEGRQSESTATLSYSSNFSSKTRNQPIQIALFNMIESAASSTGLTAVIYSGGQPRVGRRTGSRRHDNGYAADIWIYSGGRRLDSGVEADLSLIQQFVTKAKSNGISAIGMGGGYMNNVGIHVDIAYGQPGVGSAKYWGGRTARARYAPAWLRRIMQ
jgi:hypothetical protein